MVVDGGSGTATGDAVSASLAQLTGVGDLIQSEITGDIFFTDSRAIKRLDLQTNTIHFSKLLSLFCAVY